MAETNDYRPLAERMRPNSVADYIGQQHILAPGKPLRFAIEKGHLHSMVLWGPPGTGENHLSAYYCPFMRSQVHSPFSSVKRGKRYSSSDRTS